MRIAISKAFIYYNLPFPIFPTLCQRRRLQFPQSVRHRSSRAMASRPSTAEFVREDLEDLLKRRFFLSRAFDIYGGVAGLYDLGVYPFCHIFLT